jgi:hypothetical protein
VAACRLKADMNKFTSILEGLQSKEMARPEG